MESVSAAITAQDSWTPAIQAGDNGIDVSIWGTFVASVTIQRTFDNGTTWLDVEAHSVPAERHGYTTIPSSWRAGVKTGNYTSGTINIRVGN